jgi:hypothetical protein
MRKIPLWLKIVYTIYMAVLIPVYLYHYGPTNFLYFCDIALLLTLAGMWSENKLLISMPAVGILIPQALWVIDFLAQATGHRLSGLTEYMFDQERPFFLRFLSGFHGWLPFLLIYLVARVNYDPRALPAWTALAWVLCLVCYYFLPPAGAQLSDPQVPVNIDYVFGFDDKKPQHWMPPGAFLIVWMIALLAVFFVPTHFVLRKLFARAGDK